MVIASPGVSQGSVFQTLCMFLIDLKSAVDKALG